MFTVYTTTGCQGCKATIRTLDKRGINYELRNAQEHCEELKHMGFTQLPVVINDEGDAFSGFRPDRLVA